MKKKNIYKDASMVLNEEKDKFRLKDPKPLEKL